MKTPSVLESDSVCIWSGAAVCGEGPLWVPEQSVLYWVDIDGCQAHGYNTENQQVKTWTLAEKTGWLLPCEGRRELIGGANPGYISSILSHARGRCCSIQKLISPVINLTMPKQIRRGESGPAP